MAHPSDPQVLYTAMPPPHPFYATYPPPYYLPYGPYFYTYPYPHGVSQPQQGVVPTPLGGYHYVPTNIEQQQQPANPHIPIQSVPPKPSIPPVSHHIPNDTPTKADSDQPKIHEYWKGRIVAPLCGPSYQNGPVTLSAARPLTITKGKRPKALQPNLELLPPRSRVGGEHVKPDLDAEAVSLIQSRQLQSHIIRGRPFRLSAPQRLHPIARPTHRI
jgi:hypothetical protein